MESTSSSFIFLFFVTDIYFTLLFFYIFIYIFLLYICVTTLFMYLVLWFILNIHLQLFIDQFYIIHCDYIITLFTVNHTKTKYLNLLHLLLYFEISNFSHFYFNYTLLTAQSYIKNIVYTIIFFLVKHSQYAYLNLFHRFYHLKFEFSQNYFQVYFLPEELLKKNFFFLNRLLEKSNSRFTYSKIIVIINIIFSHISFFIYLRSYFKEITFKKSHLFYNTLSYWLIFNIFNIYLFQMEFKMQAKKTIFLIRFLIKKEVNIRFLISTWFNLTLKKFRT